MKREAAILIIDDELGPRESIKMALQDVCKVHLARNGKEGLSKLREGEIDVIILDIKLPHMSGIQVLNAIKKEDQDIPVIILTGYSSISSAKEAVRLGAFAYSEKPFDVHKLRALVRSALRKRWKDQQKAKEILRRIEELSKFPSENPNPVLRVMKDGTVLYSNDPGKELLAGWETGVGKIMPAWWQKLIKEAFIEVEKKKKKKTEEIEFKGRVYSFDIAPVMDAGYANLYGRDITEHKKAEKALRDSKEQFQALTESTSDWIWEVDENAIYTYISPKVKDLLGYEPAEIIGKTPFDLMPPEEAQRISTEFGAIAKSQRPFSGLENINRHKDGSLMVLETSGVPFFDSDGHFRGYRGIDRDITERKQALESLQQERDFAKSLVETAQAIILILDKNGRIIDFNPYMEELSGYRLKEVKGKDWIETFLPSREYAISHNLFCGSFPGIQTHGIVNPIITKTGEEPEIEWYSKTLKDPEGRVIGVLAVGHDITERKQAEETLRSTEDKLRHAQRMESIGRLAAGVAHDFNNNLMAMVGFSELALIKLDKSSRARGYIEEIKKVAEKAATLSRQLLIFGSRQELSRKRFSPNDVVFELLKMLHRLVGDDISIVTDLKSEVWQINADLAQLEQAIMNLSINAREAMPDGGTITIRTKNVTIGSQDRFLMAESYPGRFVCLSVMDTGIGIENEIIEQIAEPYFSTKETGQHSGLGLSTVYGIVKQHQGWLQVYSELGLGSVFNVYLPATLSKDKGEIEENFVFKKFQGKGERILLVEDETNVRKVTAQMLRENGYTVFEAPAATKALAVFKKEKGEFELVLSDVILPDESGVGLVGQLLSQKPELKVLLCSGYMDMEAHDAVMKEKGYHFLNKPFNMETLLYTLKEVIEKKQTKTKGAKRGGK